MNNVINFSKKLAEKNQTDSLADEFISANHLAEEALESTWAFMAESGIDEVEAKDFAMVQQSLCSLIMRSRGVFHPIQQVADVFHNMANEE